MANPWDSGIPVGDNTDPELLQAIEALKKQSWASKPIKPSKFNLGETRSPLELLQAEAAGENTTTTNWGNWEAQGMSLKPAKYSADKPWDKGIPVTEQPKKQAMPWDAGIPVADSIIDTIGEESDKFSNWLTKGIEEAKADRPAAVAGFLAGNVQFPMQVVESAAELATWPVHRRSWSEMQANIAKTMQEQKEALLPKKAVEMIDSPAGQAGAAVPFAPFTYPLERIPEALTEHGYPETAAAVGVLTPPVLGAVGARHMMKGGKVKEAPEPAPKERDFVPTEEVPTAKEEPSLAKEEPILRAEGLAEDLTTLHLNKANERYDPSNVEHRNNALSPEAWKSFETGDISSTLKDISSKANDPIIKAIADRLGEFTWEGVKTKIDVNLTPDGGRTLKEGQIIGGRFSAEDLTITLNPKGANTARTVLHEALHAVTLRAIADVKSIHEINLKEELGRIMNRYDEVYGKEGEIGTSFQDIVAKDHRLSEFAAELFTNEKVINNLKKVKDIPPVGGKIRTLWNKFITAISEYVGINTLGQRGMSVVDQIMSQSKRSVKAEWAKDSDLKLSNIDKGGLGVEAVRAWNAAQVRYIVKYKANGIEKSRAIYAENGFLAKQKLMAYFPDEKITNIKISKAEGFESISRDATSPQKAHNQERVIQLLRSEQTFDRFLRKAKTLDLNVTDAQWKAIFDDKERQLAKYAAEPSTFSKRSSAEKVLGTDTRDWKQFSEEVLAKAKLVKNIDDIKDLGTYLLAPRNLQFLKNRLVDGPIGAKVMSWAIDKNYNITRMWDRIASEVIHGPTREGAGITTMREFKKGREGVLKPMTDLKRKDQADVLRAWLDMEKDNSELVAKKLQWADDTMLRDKYHLTEPQIEAYKSMTKLMDTLMDITNESLIKQGREPIQKIPGFFPRYLKGRYRVHLHIKPSDVMKAAGVKGGLVDILQFKSRAAADSWLKDNFGKDPRMPDRNGFFIGRGRDGDFVQGNSLDVDIANFASDMSIAAQVMMSKGKLNPILRRRLNNLVSRASSAELRQTHERSGALTTYRGSEGIRDTLYGQLADTTEILNVFNQYTQSVFKYAKNVDLHTEVLLPIREAIGGKLPNTLRYVDEMIGNAMDNNPNKFEIFDKFLDNIQGKWVEPGTVQKAVPWINKALIAKALAGSGSFLAVQALQPYVAATMFLPMFHAEMGRFGNKVPFGAATRAMTRAFKELYVGLSPEGREAMAYAVKNHITDTAIWETLQKDLKLKGLVGDSLDKAFHRLQIRPILENIESASRGHTFMQGYFYARNAGFTKDAALGFADKYTSVMMGDYSKVFRPLMMENLGVVGHLQTPFATLMNTYIGNMAQGTSNLAKSLATMPGVNKLPYMTVVKKLPGIRDIDLTEPNRPQFKQAALAAAAFTGAVWAWSGFQGMPGVQEWQAAADKWNEHFPENPMVGPQEMMFEHDVSDFNKYGLASTLVGANIGQSMNAPSLAGRMGVPSAPLISDLGEIIWGIFRTIFSEGKTEGEKFRLASRIAPPPLRPVVEQKYTTETGMVPVPGTSLQGFRERTTGDTVARYLGTRSIEEANELARFWITQARDSRENKAKAMLSRQIMSAWMTDAPPEKIEAILDQSESVGADPQDVLDNAKDLYLGRYIGWKERKQLKAGKGISGAHKLQNLQNLYRE